MTQETILYAVISTWFLCGVAFWIEAMRYDGVPTKWRSYSDRYPGWAYWLFTTLPICLIGGPLWWIAKVIYNLPRRKGSKG